MPRNAIGQHPEEFVSASDGPERKLDGSIRNSHSGRSRLTTDPADPQPLDAEWLSYWKECRAAIGKFEGLNQQHLSAGVGILVTLATIGIAIVITNATIFGIGAFVRWAIAISLIGGVGLLWVLIHTNATLMVGAVETSMRAEHALLPCRHKENIAQCAKDLGVFNDKQREKTFWIKSRNRLFGSETPVLQLTDDDKCLLHLSCAIESKISWRKQGSGRNWTFVALLLISVALSVGLVLS